MFTFPVGFFGGAGDPYWNNVVLLLPGDGANGSTTIPDVSSSPKTITSVNGAQISTAQSKFGGSSISFSGTSGVSSRLEVPSTAAPAGSESFTFEAWLYPIAFSIDRIIFDTRIPSSIQDGNANSAGFALFVNSSNRLQVYDGGVPVLRPQSSGSLSLSTWQHIAYVKSGSTHSYYINGIDAGSFSAGNATGPSALTIGARNDQRFGFNGYIDDLRITKGVARYTANFTPPTAPFPIG